MTKPQHQVRVTLKPGGEIYESPEGRLFFDDKLAKFTDLSGVRLLRCGVDTVRQLYNGLIRPEVMAVFDEPEDIVEFAGYQWAKGRVGRDSGYQYRLQNADMGLILLIKNHNVKLENIGPHLKIEVSPHALDGADPKILQGVMDDLAAGEHQTPGSRPARGRPPPSGRPPARRRRRGRPGPAASATSRRRW